MIDNIKSEINILAEKLVTLDDEYQKEEIKTIQMRIWELFFSAGYEFEKTDRYGNDWYVFPLLGNLIAPYEPVQKALEENLRKNKKKGDKREGEWNFQPQSDEFILTIIKKAKEKVGRGADMLKGYIPEPDKDTEDNSNAPKEYPDPADPIGDLVTLISAQQDTAYIAELIVLQVWVEKGRENKQHFEGYFTHDRVEEERNSNGELITEIYNSIVFPAMCQKMMSYLMEGIFNHLYDVVKYPLRDGIDLNRTYENVGNCYEMGTMEKQHGRNYKAWLKSITTNLG